MRRSGSRQRYFAAVLQTTEAGMMIRSLFLSLQELNKGARRPANVPPTTFKKVGILGGGGFMGAGIGYVTAKAGIDVVLLDRDDAAAEKGQRPCGGNRGRGDLQGSLDACRQGSAAWPYRHHRRLRRLLADCDLVIEAVFEDSNVKKGGDRKRRRST